MTEAQSEKLFLVFINAIMEKCADEAGVSVDLLQRAYVENSATRDILNGIFKRHIKELGAN